MFLACFLLIFLINNKMEVKEVKKAITLSKALEARGEWMFPLQGKEQNTPKI
jgi:hypothetical protein